MRFSTTLSAIVLATSTLAQQKPLQVYLHPTPSDSALNSPPTLTADQAKAVLSHHLGEPIDDFEEIPSDESLWGHLMGMWDKEVVVGEKEKPRVVIIEGGVMPQDVLPTNIQQSPSFYLNEETSTRALLAPYLQRASQFLEGILHSLPALPDRLKDLFDLAKSQLYSRSGAAAALEKELTSLSALADSMPWYDHSKHSHPWEAISISGMSHLNRDDEVWEMGRKGLQAGLESMTQPGSPPLLIIIVPDHQVNQKRDLDLWDFVPFIESMGDGSEDSNESDRPSPEKPSDKRKNRTAEACYASEDDCSSSTTCFGRGSCALKGKNGDEECWGCKCNSGYAGQSCQKEDYSVPFVILILSTLFLVGALGGSIALLYTVGETKLPSTLNLAIGNPKRD